MARTLDALDAALNAPASSEQSGQQAQAGKTPSPQAAGQTSQSAQTSAAQSTDAKSAPSSMAQAQSAMAAAAQAAAAQARAARSEAGTPNQAGQPQPGLQAASKDGVQAAQGSGPRGALADAKNKAGEWGKLPKQMAEQLTQGQREGIAGEYRNQVETYYRAIAEKSKKQ
jgi:hypothetical protein